jgi:hypothetical protein
MIKLYEGFVFCLSWSLASVKSMSFNTFISDDLNNKDVYVSDNSNMQHSQNSYEGSGFTFNVEMRKFHDIWKSEFL